MRIIGLDLGGTKCTLVESDQSMNIKVIESINTSTADQTLKKVFKIIEHLKPDKDTLFGISCGDPMDSKRGIILSPPNMRGWDNVHITKMLQDKFGGHAYLMNDANAGALAEWKFGAAKGYENIVFCTHGTGMGAGLILNNKLYEGMNGSAGEIGHIRLERIGPVGYGKSGSFEGFCSGGGIAQIARERAAKLGGKVSFNPGLIEEITTKDVALAAEKGDKTAIDILAYSGSYLGKGLSIIIDVLNPQIIVLGSLFIRCRKYIEPNMLEELKKEALPQSLKNCKIVPAGLDENIGNYAAICVALYRKDVF